MLAACFLFIYTGGAQDPKLILPIGHTEVVTFAQFSPDGKKILTASYDHSAKLWDAFSGALLADLTGHQSSVYTARFSPDGKTIVTASADHTAKIWNAGTGKLVVDLKGHTDDVNTAWFSPDGKKIVTASNDHTAKVWDAFSGKLLTQCTAHSSWVRSAQFSPDSKKVVTVSDDSTTKIWDPVSGNILLELKRNNSWIIAAQFSPDSKKIVIGATRGSLTILNAETGQLILDLKGHLDWVSSIRFSPDGKKIVSSSGSLDKEAKIWNSNTGVLLAKLKGHVNEVVSAQFSPDGTKILTTAGFDGAKIWSANTGKLLINLNGHWSSVWAAHFSPDGKKVVTASQDLTAKIWNVATGKLSVDLVGHTSSVKTIQFSPDYQKIIILQPYAAVIWEILSGRIVRVINGHAATLNTARFSPDGRKIVTASNDKTAKIWDEATGALLAELKHNDYVATAQFSPDGEKIITTTEFSGLVKIWNATTGELVANMQHGDFIVSVNFSEDYKKIVTGSADNTAKIWDVTTGALLATLKVDGPNAAVVSAKFSRDGSKIITASWLSAKIWDAASGKLVTELKGHTNSVRTADFSSDEKKIITTSADNTIKIWNAASGMLVSDLKDHTAYVQSIEFSPDGKKIITTGGKTAKIWEVDTGTLLTDLIGHTGDVNFAAFSPDGKKALSASWSDGTVKLWDTENSKLLADLNQHSNAIVYARFSLTGNSIITASADNTVKLWDAGTGTLVATFFAVDSSDYFIQLPSGYYQCTTNASKLLHYVTNDLKVITFEQLDVKYNRPDKVLAALGNTDTALIKSYRKAWEKRIERLGIDTTAFREGYSVPEADFANREQTGYEQKSGNLLLHIKGFDSTYIVDRFNIWVNEIPVYGQKGISIRGSNRNNFDTTVTIKLSQGDNRVETSVTNVNGTESYRMPLDVAYAPVVKQKETTRFIGIGIEQFSDKQYNLQYSVKDIRDLADSLKRKYKGTIIIDTLFNTSVTIQNVKALKQQLLQTTENDKVIVAYSGHGLLSKEYDYYLSTYTVNFDKPEQNGLPYDELESLLDSIPARKKLMLIDACHSGEVDKEDLVILNASSDSLIKGLKPVAYKQEGHLGLKNSFELMQSLFVNVGKSTGATIISAAAGTQFALERNDLKNGVFTYSILEAMKTNATMKISKLKTIVGKRVEELTKGLQKPTSRNETIAVDWSLW